MRNLLRRVLVPTAGGAPVPLGQLADVKIAAGPAMIGDENGFLSGHFYVDIAGRDVGGYVEEAKTLVRNELRLKPGYALQWSGQYENMVRVKERLKIVVPITPASSCCSSSTCRTRSAGNAARCATRAAWTRRSSTGR